MNKDKKNPVQTSNHNMRHNEHGVRKYDIIKG